MINENKKRGRKKKDSDYNNIFAKNLRKFIDKNKVTHDAIAKK